MRSLVIAIGCVLASMSVAGQSLSQHPLENMSKAHPLPIASEPFSPPNASVLHPLPVAGQPFPSNSVGQHRLGAVSDWSTRHLIFSATGNPAIMTRLQNNPRYTQNWYRRHRRILWPGSPQSRLRPVPSLKRDWNVSLGTAPFATFEPIFDYSFNISPETGNGSFNTTDLFNGTFAATSGYLSVTGGSDQGQYALVPGNASGSSQASPFGDFNFDNVSSPAANPPIDSTGFLFGSAPLQISLQGNGANTYSYVAYNGTTFSPQITNQTGTFTVNTDPGGGQTYPAKYNFDLTTDTPSCSDFVAMGLPALPSSSQANIVGYSNLYSGTNPSNGLCGTGGPSVMFAYDANIGEVPASISISLDGTQLAFVEDVQPGSFAVPAGESFFHSLTIGQATSGSNGTSATAPAAPGAGNSAIDNFIPLTPDGTTSQPSTTAPFIDYTTNAAYVTTYTWAAGGSGYLYKISNVFGGGTPSIAWKVPITAVPSGPVYDSISNNVFFIDNNGRIDFVTDTGSTPTVTYGSVIAAGNTSLSPVTVDSVNEMVYATFNTNGTNPIVVQAPIGSLGSAVSASIGLGNTSYTGPYGVDFNNLYYTGTPTTGETSPLLYVVGTDGTLGTEPTIYGFNITGGVLNPTPAGTATLTTGIADASAPTEFYNANSATDYVFVGVSNDCVFGPGGCVVAINVSTSTFADIPAAGGSTNIIVDNDGTDGQESNIYYGTKTGGTLVKATQSGLN